MYDVPLSVIATRCHLSPRRGSLFFLKLHLLTQPFRLLARLAATSAILRPIFHAMKNVGRVILEECKGQAQGVFSLDIYLKFK